VNASDRTRNPRVAALAAVVGCVTLLVPLSCSEPGRCNGMHRLETVIQPSLQPIELLWEGSSVDVHWETPTCLQVTSQVKDSRGFTFGQDLCVQLPASGSPTVYVDEWVVMPAEDNQDRGYASDLKGVATISSNGAGLGGPSGPDLIINYEYQGVNYASSGIYRKGGVHLGTAQLRRDE